MIPDAELLDELTVDPTNQDYRENPLADRFSSTQRILNKLAGGRFIRNPATATQILQPFAAVELFGLIDKARRGSIAKLALALAVQHDIERQNRPALKNWALLLLDAGELIADEYAAINKRLDQTYADPDHPATVATQPRLFERWGPKATTTRSQINEVLDRDADAWE